MRDQELDVLGVLTANDGHEFHLGHSGVRIARVGFAKQVNQVHAVDASERRAVARAFKREQFFALCTQLSAGCVVAMDACSWMQATNSAHGSYGGEARVRTLARLDEPLRWCDRQVGQHLPANPAAKRAAKVIGIGELGEHPRVAWRVLRRGGHAATSASSSSCWLGNSAS
ncbi:MAG: hypothetical protein Q7U73_14055 [Rubrivivax sp.]|nr:hypothetical protein [Rubrivivax sp.]